MSWQTLLAVGLGGFFGAISRMLLTGVFHRLFPHSINFGTLAVNIIGSFVIGVLFGIFFYFSVNPHIKSFVVTGFLGALTTFSTFALETLFLADGGSFKYAIFNVFLNVAFTLFFVALGFYGTKAIIPLFFRGLKC